MDRLKFFKDTLEHKRLILEIGSKLVNHLEEEEKTKEALMLTKRLIVHDESKISREEVQAFCSIEENQNMCDPNIMINDSMRKGIAVHWKNNRHHPEHFEDYHEMNELDIMEMVCDWYARSMQHKTDFLDFVKTRQNNRFKFDDAFFEKILAYCHLLLKLDGKE